MRILLIIILVFEFSILQSQQVAIERQLIGSAGESKTVGTINYDWSLGEIIIDQSNIYNTQGFQQNIIILNNNKRNPGTNYNTIITPGDQSLNNKLVFDSITIAVELTVFDKWGSMLYNMKDYDGTFEGYTKAGLIIPDGVYIYLLQDTIGNIVYKGSITIKRK